MLTSLRRAWRIFRAAYHEARAVRRLDGVGPDEHFSGPDIDDGFSDGDDYEIWDIAYDDSLVG